LQGAVEALHLAVLPGAMRLDERLAGAETGDDLAQRVFVGPGVEFLMDVKRRRGS
jgi:hypothetical protein